MHYLDDIDYGTPEFPDFFDEMPLWSAPFGQLLLDRIPLHRGATILDVGCGTGFLAIELAQRCGGDSKVIAVDTWSHALARLKRKLDFFGIKSVETIEADAARLGIPEGVVDLLVCNLGLNNFEHVDEVLASVRRKMKPGAKAFFTSNLVGHWQDFYDVFRTTLVELGRTDRIAELDEHIGHRGTTRSIEALLKRFGFRVDDVAEKWFRMRFADGTSFFNHYFVRLGFMGAWKKIAAGPRLRETFDRLERNLDTMAARKGELSLTVPMALFEATAV